MGMKIKLLCFSVLVVCLASCGNRQQVDLVVHHGIVNSLDSVNSLTEAFAVNDGKIIAMGKNDDILLKYKGADVVNAKGYPVYPGFIDAHAHFLGYGRSLFEVNLYDSKNWDEVIDRVKKFVKTHPDELWIRGRGWDQNKFPNIAYPDNNLLSTTFPGKAILLERVDGHAAIASITALELAKLTPSTSIAGGELEVKDGKLTGLLIDNAVEMVTVVIPRPKKADYEKWLLEAQKNCFIAGLTTVTDCGLMYYEIEMMDTLHHNGKLKMRVYAMLTDSASNLSRYLSKPPYKTERLFVKGVKAYADGALGSRGACMLQPYADKPGWSGFLLNPISHYDSLAAMLVNTDFQMCTHAIGDSGNRMALRIYNKYLKGKNDKRWRIEHAQVVDEADFQLFGSASVIPSVQPTHATSDMYWAADRIGPARMKGAYAYRQLLAQNGWIALGTDFPVEDISPIKTFYAAVVRKDAAGAPSGGFQINNSLSREQALRGMTIWAAKANCMERETGSLEIGKKADFIILNKDLLHAPDAELMDTRVFTTFVNGEQVYGL
jgi:predicted amidohydrolase YtcJ